MIIVTLILFIILSPLLLKNIEYFINYRLATGILYDHNKVHTQRKAASANKKSKNLRDYVQRV